MGWVTLKGIFLDSTKKILYVILLGKKTNL